MLFTVFYVIMMVDEMRNKFRCNVAPCGNVIRTMM